MNKISDLQNYRELTTAAREKWSWSLQEYLQVRKAVNILGEDFTLTFPEDEDRQQQVVS